MAFFVLGALGLALAAAVSIAFWRTSQEDAGSEAAVSPKQPSPVSGASAATVDPPRRPRIRAAYNPSREPSGPKVNLEETGGLYELPVERGFFSYRGLSFRYPRSWELVSSGGFVGLVGNNLWVAPIGVSEDDRVLIMANYFPWQYSKRQIRAKAGDLLDTVVGSQDGQILRRPSPVKTGGVTVFWSDFTGTTPSDVEAVTRSYLFIWNDVEFYFACQEAVDGRASIIRGCDRIFSTLRLGVPS